MVRRGRYRISSKPRTVLQDLQSQDGAASSHAHTSSPEVEQTKVADGRTEGFAKKLAQFARAPDLSPIQQGMSTIESTMQPAAAGMGWTSQDLIIPTQPKNQP